MVKFISGYGFAWFGHFFVGRNRPATFKAPLYRLIGDYKMFLLMLGARMNREVVRCRDELRKRGQA